MNEIVWIISSMIGGLLFYIWCLAIGSKGLTILKIDVSSEERIILSASLGVGIAACLLLGIGFVTYTKSILLILAGIITIISFYEFPKLYAAIKSIQLNKVYESKFSIFCIVVFIVFSCLFVLIAASPETEWDAISFHLATAKVYVEQQQIIPIYYAYHTSLSHLFDMVYIVGEMWNSDIFSRMFVLLCNITIALGIWSISKKLFSEKTGIYGACIFLTTPILMVYMPATYIDIPLGLFALGSIVSLYYWKEKKEVQWVILTGILCSCMITSKIITVPFAIACTAYILLETWQTKKIRNGIKAAIIIGACIVLMMIPWMTFNYYYFNNPVYPFAEGIFHGKYWSPELAQWWQESRNTYSGGKNIFDFILKPFILTYFPNINGPIYGFSPVYMMFLPLIVLWISNKKKEIAPFIIITSISWIGWFILAPDMRYMFYMIPFFAIGTGFVIDSILCDKEIKEYVKKIVILLVVLIIISNTIFFFVIFRNDVQMWVGKITREQYITLDTPNYPIAQWANENLPKNAHIFLANDDKGYYFDRKYTTGYGIFSTYVDYAHLENSDELYERLKEIGITHVLFKEYENKNLIGYDNYYNDHTTGLFLELKQEHCTKLYEENNIELCALT